MQNQILNFNTALSEISELWQLQTIAESDAHLFKLIKFEGEFEWHAHSENKVILVLDGNMHIDFKDRDTLVLTKGDMANVPKDVLHKPVADGICGILLIEKRCNSPLE